MELHELKLSWDTLTEQLEKQQKLSTRLIEQATRQNYRSSLNKIAWPEFAGSIVCVMAAIVLAGNFKKLDSSLLQLFGAISLLFLLVFPVISFQSLRGLKNIPISMNAYADTIKKFADRKIRFQKLQKMAIKLCYIFNIVFIPVVARIFDGKDISQSKIFWFLMVPVSTVFLYFFSKWAFRCYDRSLKSAEELLSEIEG
jgi:hypothetical protein